MKKRKLSEDEFNRLLRLKQGGYSWLKIQREAGIPRRIAKRAYEDWQKEQTFAELKESRRTVATEAFRDHVESLIKLATFFAMHLDILRTIPAESPSSTQFLDNLWVMNILGESQELTLSGDSTSNGERKKRLNTRQNQLLFKALQDHTRGDLKWEILKEWGSAWDNCKQVYADLVSTASIIIGNFLKQDPGITKKIKVDSQGQDTTIRIVDALTRRLWTLILSDKINQLQDIFEVITVPGGVTYAAITEVGNSVFLTFNDKGLAEKAVRLGNQTAKNLLLGENVDLIESLKEYIGAMKRATEELADMLNPLMLRPIILRTRCELCPA